MCDLENEYSPSVWNQRFKTSYEVINFHLKFVEEKTNESRKQFNCDLNIPYGTGTNEKYDLYHNGLPDGTMIFLFFDSSYF